MKKVERSPKSLRIYIAPRMCYYSTYFEESIVTTHREH